MDKNKMRKMPGRRGPLLVLTGPASPVVADGASTDGASTDGASTDGASTDGASTDGASTDASVIGRARGLPAEGRAVEAPR